MKTREEVKRELEKQFLHRLQLRMDRKLKNCCRNCNLRRETEFDLGEFGKQVKYSCLEDKIPKEGQECKFFKPAYTHDSIVQEMLSDVRDPSICGAKEPKIAALMWVLHEDPEDEEDKSGCAPTETRTAGGIMSWLGTLFK